MPDNDKRSLVNELESAVEAMLRGKPVVLAPDPDMVALMGVASELRDLPRESFLHNLQNELQQEGDRMIATKQNAAPEGYKTLTPYLVSAKALQTVEFMKQAFGAVETFRSTGGAGGYHIEVKIGDSMLMIGGGGQYRGDDRLTPLHFFVDDVDEAYRRAIAAGATSLYPPTDQRHGARDCGVRDPGGADWYISNPVTYSQGTLRAGDLAPYLNPKGAEQFIDFAKRAFGAEEIETHREAGRVAHSKLRIGDSILEVGEPHGEYQTTRTMLFLYVDNADAWFNRAVTAGGRVVSPMSDLPYGRSGGVEDGFGNQWYVCTPPPPK
jgi:PhnB protein